MTLIDKVMDGEKLDRGHAELLEIGDARLMREPRVGAAQILGNGRIANAESLDVNLVNHRVGQRDIQLGIAAPVEFSVDDDTFRNPGRTVLRVHLQVVSRGHIVGKDRLLPVHLAGDRLGIWIDQQLVEIEPVTLFRVPRPSTR